MSDEEKAIEILKAYKLVLENCCSNQLDEDIKAFDLAIKALEESQDTEDGYRQGYIVGSMGADFDDRDFS